MGLFGRKKPEPVVKRVNEDIVPPEIQDLELQMSSRVAGQKRAIAQFVRVHETVMAGMQSPDRPLGVFLFVGPTGSGKTHVAKVFAEIQDVTLIKIDCGEFQHSHEIAKLIGAPPGYVGGEVQPKISKAAIEAKWKTGKNKYTVILFDEVEKANPALHQMLLGITADGIFTTGKNEEVSLKNCIIVMTSNLGSGEVKKLLQTKGGYGFIAKNEEDTEGGESALDDAIYRASKEAVKKFFSPEFFNRIDRMVVFRSLTDEMLRRILDIELNRVQDRILRSEKYVAVEVSSRGKDFLIREGTSKEFGARELTRSIERFLVSKLTRAFATNQAKSGDMIVADKEDGTDDMVLDITVDAMIVPVKVEKVPEVKQPARVSITPENPNLLRPEPGKIDPNYCARCGFRWYTAHVCFDLVDSPLEAYRKEIEKRRPSKT